MGRYVYEAVSEAGERLRGRLVADSAAEVQERILAMDCLPLRVRPDSLAPGAGLWGGLVPGGEVGTGERILLIRQLRTMLGAGVPMLTILGVLTEQAEHPRLRAICAAMTEAVRRGASLSAALAAHPEAFPDLCVSMVRAGEAAGALPEVLDRLIYILSHEQEVRRDIRSALQYPATVAVALVGAFFFLLAFVIPTFARMFAKAHIALPWPTRVALALHTAVVAHWYVAASIAGVVLVALWIWLRTAGGRLVRDRLLLALPLVGGVLRKAAMSRFASVFSILQASGVPVLSALDIVTGSIGNTAVARELSGLTERVRTGQGLAGPLARARYFPPMVVSMVAVGEESGSLETMLGAISEHYDAEVSYAAKRLSEALGPLLVLGLAVVVGFFALAVFTPMWDMTRLAARL